MRRRGFTLLELLVALAIMTFVTTLAYSSLNTSIKTIERREARAQALHRGHFILRHLTDNVRNIHVERDAYFRASSGDEGEAVAPEPFVGEADKLSFWTRSQPHARRNKAGDLIRLTYSTAQPEDDDAVDRGTDTLELVVEARSDLSLDDEPDARWTLPVQSVNFEYFDGVAWIGLWDVESEQRLPRGVRMTVELPGDAADAEPLTLTTTVPIQVSTFIMMEPPEEQVSGDAVEESADADADAQAPDPNAPGGPNAS